MKNTSIGIQAVLAIAVIVLYILHFTQKPSDSSSQDQTAEKIEDEKVIDTPTEEKKPSKNTDQVKFAYVNSDSLLKKYEYYQKVQQQLEGKRASLEAEFKGRQTALQNEVMNFQKSISEGKMTEQTARQTQQTLMQKEQSLVQEGQQRESFLIKEEQDLSKKLNEKIADFLKRFAENNGYEMIFSFSLNTMAVGVMHSNPELNVTNEVINGLNEEYKASNK